MTYYFVRHNGLWTAIDNNGNKVATIPFEDFSYLGDDRIGFRENGKYGVSDIFGRIVCPAKFDNVFKHFEGLALVEIDKKFGYINRGGELVIPCSFYSARQFSCGLAAVQETMMSPWGYISSSGDHQILPKYRTVKNFSEGLGAVCVDDGWGFLNHSGSFVIEPRFDLVNSFSEGLSAVTTNIKTLQYGFIDLTGVYQLKPAFYGPDMRFSEGLAAVYGKAGFGFIDRAGEIEIPFQFHNSHHFCEGLCCVCIKKRGKMRWGFINKDGEMMIEPQFTVATDFSEGLAMVESKDCWGYINSRGEFVWSTNEPR